MPSADARRSGTLKPVKDGHRLSAIIEAVGGYDIASSHAWSDLDELSKHTEVEALEPNPDGIFEIDDDRFEATATVYVTLNYGDRKDSTSISDSFPVHVRGKIKKGNKIIIEDVKVDTTSFYQ